MELGHGKNLMWLVREETSICGVYGYKQLISTLNEDKNRTM